MSVLFPKTNKPREWDYRPIYYDKDKEARKDRKLARLHHGSFREEHEKNMTELRRKRPSRLLLLIALLAILIFGVYILL